MNELKLSGKIYNVKKIPTKTGKDFTTGSIMISRQDKTTNTWVNGFVPFKAFGTSALDIASMPEKSRVILGGKLGVDEYQDKKTGEKKTNIYIMVFNAEIDTKEFKADPKAVDDVKSYGLTKQLEIPTPNDTDIPW